MGKRTCVSLAFLKNTIFPLLSTKHVALRTTIAQEIAYHKQSIQHNRTNQTIEKYLFNDLDLLICYDRKIWQRKYEL
jgi:hypothetical protein